MNRVKVWIFTLLVVAAGLLAARAAAISMRADALGALDARLAGAAGHVSASTAGIARQASAAAALLARDDGLLGALRSKDAAAAPAAARGRRTAPAAPPAPEAPADGAALRDAAAGALATAEKALGFTLPVGTVAVAGTRGSLGAPADGGDADDGAAAILRAAVGGEPRRGFLRSGGALWYGVATPAGEGAAVEVLVPLDETWARTLATAAGTDVTLAVTGVKPVTTARASDAPLLEAAARATGAADVGAAGKVRVSLGSVELPPLPDPLGGGPALRARAVPLEGVGAGSVVVSLPAGAAVSGPASFLYRAVAGLALVLLVGFLLGFLVRSVEPAAQVPEALYAAAARIEKGDFAARAPQLAGKLGTVAAALNRAAEVAGPAQATSGAPPAREGELEGLAQPPRREPDAFELPPRAAAPAEPAPFELPSAPPAEPASFEFPPPPAPPAEPASFEFPPPPAPPAEPASFEFPPPPARPEPLGFEFPPRAQPSAPVPAPAPAATRTATLPAAAPPPAAPAAAPGPEDEEAHWHQVFQDFLRTRASCGESTDALTYEKFRQKLESNRAQLVAKYACKTVRFQVYVKEGKAALKATPVR